MDESNAPLPAPEGGGLDCAGCTPAAGTGGGGGGACIDGGGGGGDTTFDCFGGLLLLLLRFPFPEHTHKKMKKEFKSKRI